MPWSNQTGGGGGWKSGGGGNGGGPWGQGPQGQRPSGKSPDLEEILKRGQDRLRRAIPGGGGGGGGGRGGPGAGGSGGGVALGGLILILFAVIWAFNAIHMVQPGEYGVKVFLGKPREQLASEGLNFTLWPLETFATVPAVENQLAIGRTGTDTTGGNSPGLMLSGDQNIVNVQFSVLYRIDRPQDYLFNVDDPQGMLRQVSESAMREVVGRRPVDEVFRDNRAGIAESVRAIIQDALDRYGAGIRISGVSIEDAAPPQQVATAFEEVQRAGQDQIRFVEEASLYRNQQLGRARGEALQIREDAAAEKNRLIQDANGESQRFTDILDEYEKAPEVTRKRLFLETMESVYGDSKKVLVDGSVGQQGVVPYLPLGSLQTPAAPNAATPARPAGQTSNTIPASPATIQGTN